MNGPEFELQPPQTVIDAEATRKVRASVQELALVLRLADGLATACGVYPARLRVILGDELVDAALKWGEVR